MHHVGARPASAVQLTVGEAHGCAGEAAELRVTMDNEGAMVRGVQNDLLFSGPVMIATKVGSADPDCAVGAGVAGITAGFSFRPAQCTPGVDCTAVRVVLFSSLNEIVVPAGGPLYTCTVAIAGDASGSLPLACANSNASDPNGGALDAVCEDGAVVIDECPPDPPECPGDLDDNREVTIDELVRAVRSALDGCPEE